MSIKRTCILAALGVLSAGAGWALWGELPTAPLGTIDVEAAGLYADRVDSVIVVLDDPDNPTAARVVVWIDGVPASCVSTDRGQRGWVEVHPQGFEHSPVAGGRFFEDPDCGVTVTLPGEDGIPAELRFAGVVP